MSCPNPTKRRPIIVVIIIAIIITAEQVLCKESHDVGEKERYHLISENAVEASVIELDEPIQTLYLIVAHRASAHPLGGAGEVPCNGRLLVLSDLLQELFVFLSLCLSSSLFTLLSREMTPRTKSRT